MGLEQFWSEDDPHGRTAVKLGLARSSSID